MLDQKYFYITLFTCICENPDKTFQSKVILKVENIVLNMAISLSMIFCHVAKNVNTYQTMHLVPA